MVSDCNTSLGWDNGYGYRTVYCPNKKKKVKAHRFVWEQHHGKIPDGFVIMHTCDNRACVNTNHLKLGTQSENLKDMYRKGRQGVRKFPTGEEHNMTTLSENQVSKIRSTPYYRGMYSKFAKEMGVTRQTISNIKRGLTWPNYQEPNMKGLGL